MNQYDIFKSEGGYRVCGAVWDNGPVIDRSPWFATMEEAEAGRERMRRRDEIWWKNSILTPVPAWFIELCERGEID